MKYKFNIGDRVTCICEVDDNEDIVGKSGEIVNYDAVGRPGVYFDEKIEGGHGVGGNAPYGYGWYCDLSALEPEEFNGEAFSAPEPFWP